MNEQSTNCRICSKEFTDKEQMFMKKPRGICDKEHVTVVHEQQKDKKYLKEQIVEFAIKNLLIKSM